MCVREREVLEGRRRDAAGGRGDTSTARDEAGGRRGGNVVVGRVGWRQGEGRLRPPHQSRGSRSSSYTDPRERSLAVTPPTGAKAMDRLGYRQTIPKFGR